MVRTADISEAVQHIVNAITNAANNSIPKTSPRRRKFRKPWWNAACRDSRRREKILWNRFRRYTTTENLVAFKQAKALARRIRRHFLPSYVHGGLYVDDLQISCQGSNMNTIERQLQNAVN
ncbi:hypothetical protein AVEN_98286-1 [Araneus ventricosus]|uniref:Reverse transcriptase domain-containing protein n=1 Tax=Araneus ventricosus TaxID=182803 RepID=A0A4Y2TAF6_ARAVE|nr:hypothetical protein AVEN_98286-1 [Araneus ventricosus]